MSFYQSQWKYPPLVNTRLLIIYNDLNITNQNYLLYSGIIYFNGSLIATVIGYLRCNTFTNHLVKKDIIKFIELFFYPKNVLHCVYDYTGLQKKFRTI